MKKITGLLISGLLISGLPSIGAHAADYDQQKRYPAVKIMEIPAPPCVEFKRIPENSVPSVENDYQIARKIWEDDEVGLFPQMYELGERAARAGHLRAMLLMATLYTEEKIDNGFYEYIEFNPQKAEQYLNYLMERGYTEAFFTMANIRSHSIIKTASPASFFFNRALENGHPLAMMGIARLHIDSRDTAKAKPFLHCAAQNGSGAALNMLALAQNLNAKTKSDWDTAFNTLWLAAKAGNSSSFKEFARFNQDYKAQQGKDYLSPEFLKRADRFADSLHKGLFLNDPYRASIGQNPLKKGSTYRKYPNLETVLPLPPAPLPAWNGDMTRAMSAVDARYYREDYTLTRLNAMLGRRNDVPGGKLVVFYCDNKKNCRVK
ncbi:TPA: sel1 repeat family protein [Providencia alcalifaciens]|nr:sel1 repeat family protein [Providencia alcalifaciens]